MATQTLMATLSRRVLILLGLTALTASAFADQLKSGDIVIVHPHARPTVAQQSTGAAYIGMHNTSTIDDRLVKIEAAVAKSVEIHTMEMSGDIMKMREVDGIDVKAGSQITMEPGQGYHIMLIGLKQPLKVGDKFPMTLTFAKSGKVVVQVVVEANSN